VLKRWHHCVATWDGTTAIKLFVNGREVAYQTSTAGSGAASAEAAQNLTFGSNTGAGIPADGRLDDLRVYRRVLGPKEIWAAYVNSLTGYPDLLNRLPLFAAPPVAAGSTILSQMLQHAA
jgi:hypothetical protein